MTMESDNIEKLYKNFAVLADAKDKIGEHEAEYLEILKAVKGSQREKRLASQFLTRFFKSFPNLAEQAIESLLDLCEDEDVSIRKQAIKDLPVLCKDNRGYTQKIADILAQLLQAEDLGELSVVNNSLMTLLKTDAKGSLAGLFSQILAGEDFVREKAIKFLTSKVRGIDSDILNKEAEDYLINETKKVLQDVTANEFNVLMDLLDSTKLGKTVSGHQELVDIVAEQAEIEQPFNPSDGEENELLDRLINCVKHALPYFSTQIKSTKFVNYICIEVLPKLDKIISSEEDSPIELELLKVFAELCTHTGAVDKPDVIIDNVFKKLIGYMPLPPADTEELSTEPRLEFSFVECLMYAFHKLLRQSPTYLTADADRLRDFKIRLQYFARGIQGYIKKLREALANKQPEELKTDENKLKVVALMTTSNINTLIKDLFHSPPSFKSIISLSWKPPGNAKQKPGSSPGVKRQFASEGDTASKSKKNSTEIYAPPGGKFSTKVGNYFNVKGGGGGGGGGRFKRRFRSSGGGGSGNRGRFGGNMSWKSSF